MKSIIKIISIFPLSFKQSTNKNFPIPIFQFWIPYLNRAKILPFDFGNNNSLFKYLSRIESILIPNFY